MYKVMLVDDDYPVLELLSEALDWERLGLSLQGAYSNGAEAWEHAREQMPDILITDIGMPRLNGLELIACMKERHPQLRAVILSCHSEFQFAQQAMKMNVQDYVLKDTLDPADLEKLLLRLKEGLDQEQVLDRTRLQLQNWADRSRSSLRGTFIRHLAHQPLAHSDSFYEEARRLGLELAGISCLPLLVLVDRFREARQRFMTGDTLQFALENVMEETLCRREGAGTLFPYSQMEMVLLLPFQPDIRYNCYEEARSIARAMQRELQTTLKLSISVLIGRSAASPAALKQNLYELLAAKEQRFYMSHGQVKSLAVCTPGQSDLFACYDEALGQFRDLLVAGDRDGLAEAVRFWFEEISKRRYPPEMVKDWVLKLLLDLKLKLQSLQHFRSFFSVEAMHNEVLDIHTLEELCAWMGEHLQTTQDVMGELLDHSRRVEVLDAIQFISRHLDKRISLEEVARHLHLNASYFSRLFRKETGETFIEFVTRTKMERAKEMLDQTSLPVSRICEQLGYDNQSYFIKTFKTQTGLTPVEFRGRRHEA